MFKNKTFYWFALILYFVITVSADYTEGQNGSQHFCMKPVNTTIYPDCDIKFREERGYSYFNATCLENNVFLVQQNRTRPERGYSYAHYEQHLAIAYEDDQVPPYVTIQCNALYPTDFYFEGVESPELFRVWRQMSINQQNLTIQTLHVEILVSPEATGSYIVRSIENPKIEIKFFIFSERGMKPYLLGSGRIVQAISLNGTTTILPCVSSDLETTNITIFKLQNKTNWVKYLRKDPILYDPQRGFLINSVEPGDYRCYANFNTNSSRNATADDDPDEYVTVHVKSPNEHANQSHSRLWFDITQTRAVCYSMEKVNLEFSNTEASNPTESRLVVQCLDKKNLYCANQGYYAKQHGRRIKHACPRNASSCLWITNFRRQGVFHCAIAAIDGPVDPIVLEYFTGVDNQIYDTKNISKSMAKALIQPIWYPDWNHTDLVTGRLYNVYCTHVGDIFTPSNKMLSFKFKNGTIIEAEGADHYWYGSWSAGNVLLSPETEEIICGFNFMKTNERLSVGIKVNVTKVKCGSDRFECNNGQCIYSHYRCDGSPDCIDRSDEFNCTSYNCNENSFKCANGECIRGWKKCDNRADCSDASDEAYLTCFDTPCPTERFRCASGQCIYGNQICNGRNDCYDKSDEDVAQCATFQPEFEKTPLEYTFTINTREEIICRTKALSKGFTPSMWWRRGLVDLKDSVWNSSNAKGQQLLLRFDNVSQGDGGEYTCIAGNRLKRIQQIFKVKVVPADVTCSPDLGKTECLKRDCFYIRNVCTGEEEEPTTTTTTIRSVATPTAITTTTSTTTTTTNSPLKDSQQGPSSESGDKIVVAIAATLLILTVIAVLTFVGLRWKQIMNQIGYSRHRSGDEERVMNGIQLQRRGN